MTTRHSNFLVVPSPYCQITREEVFTKYFLNMLLFTFINKLITKRILKWNYTNICRRTYSTLFKSNTLLIVCSTIFGFFLYILDNKYIIMIIWELKNKNGNDNIIHIYFNFLIKFLILIGQLGAAECQKPTRNFDRMSNLHGQSLDHKKSQILHCVQNIFNSYLIKPFGNLNY